MVVARGRVLGEHEVAPTGSCSAERSLSAVGDEFVLAARYRTGTLCEAASPASTVGSGREIGLLDADVWCAA